MVSVITLFVFADWYPQKLDSYLPTETEKSGAISFNDYNSKDGP